MSLFYYYCFYVFIYLFWVPQAWRIYRASESHAPAVGPSKAGLLFQCFISTLFCHSGIAAKLLWIRAWRNLLLLGTCSQFFAKRLPYSLLEKDSACISGVWATSRLRELYYKINHLSASFLRYISPCPIYPKRGANLWLWRIHGKERMGRNPVTCLPQNKIACNLGSGTGYGDGAICCHSSGQRHFLSIYSTTTTPSSPLPLTFNTESTQQAVGDFYQLQRVSSLCFCPVIATCSSFLELCTPKSPGWVTIPWGQITAWGRERIFSRWIWVLKLKGRGI